jgi:hypothetical protein
MRQLPQYQLSGLSRSSSYTVSIMAKMIEIEEHALELLLDQKEAAENRCIELELTVGLLPGVSSERGTANEESYRISRPQWVAFVHLCTLMGHPLHLDLSPALDLGRSDHTRCRLPQEEVDWLNTKIASIFGGIKLLLTVPVAPCLGLSDTQFSEHGYGDIYTPVTGLSLVIQETNIYQFPHDPRWPQSLRAAWGSMTAYECLASTFSPVVHQNQVGYPAQVMSSRTYHPQRATPGTSYSGPVYLGGNYDIFTMQGACPF